MLQIGRSPSNTRRGEGSGAVGAATGALACAKSRAEATCQQWNVLTDAPGTKVVAGLSAGADSSALVAVLVELGCDVLAVHVDHGMRAGSSDEPRLAEAIAKRLGAAFESVRVKVDPPTEAEARAQRYEALAAAASRWEASIIAVGHTSDDQAETVALRLERGGFGLPMPYIRPLGKATLVRPLLDQARADTEAVCRELGIAFFKDPSNKDLALKRNRLRAELGDDKVAKRQLIDHGQQAAALTEQTKAEVRELWETSVRHEDDLIAIDLPSVPVHLLSALVRSALASFDIEPSRPGMQALLKRIAGPKGTRLDLPGEAAAWKEGPALMLGPWPDRPEMPEVKLALDAEVLSEQWGLVFRLSSDSAPADHRRNTLDPVQMFDAEAMGGPILIRQWRPGDRMHPLGAPGSKKLQDLFTDLKVPQRIRHRVPLLVCRDQIAWVVGYRIADPFKLTYRSKAAVKAEVLQAASRDD